MDNLNYNGCWEETPTGQKVWKGDFSSSETVGKAKINYLFDKIHNVENAKVSETERKNLEVSLKSRENFNQEDFYRYQNDDGSWTHGTIHILQDDVIFQPEKTEHTKPKKRKYDLEYDMFNNKELMRLVQDDKFAANLYSALCNVDWYFEDQKNPWCCSWRGAGRIIANMRQKGEEYMDFYSSGNEGIVSPEIKKMFKKMKWKPKTFMDKK